MILVSVLINLYHSMGKFSRRQISDMFCFGFVSIFFFFFFRGGGDRVGGVCFVFLFFFYFSQETGFGILCLLSPFQTICMNCEILFSGKISKIFHNVVC